MAHISPAPTSQCHIVAVPYPGRGHVNPLMNLCNLMLVKNPSILITFVVTEEWLGFIESEPKPDNIRFATLPNVIPSEHGRAKDFPGFIEAVYTKLEEPFQQLLDRIELPVSVIVADSYVVWAAKVGKMRSIPVASLWPMSATVFSVFYHFEELVKNGHFPAEISEQGNEQVDYIPGVPPLRLADFPTIFHGTGRQVVHRALEAVSSASGAQYLLFASVYELEKSVVDDFKCKLPFSVYPMGPIIPYFKLEEHSLVTTTQNVPDYLHWLDLQPSASVLYVSQGSFLSVSSAQMDEIVAGIRDSGVRFLWVARGENSLFKDGVGDTGMIVPWCDQLKVLCHSSVGGFWTHCGLSSIVEAVYAGVPMLTSPIIWDQIPNSKQIVNDWKIGWKVKKDAGGETLVTRDEIRDLVKKLMDPENTEGKEMRKRAKDLRKVCRDATVEGGSSMISLDAFIHDITKKAMLKDMLT